MCYIFSHIVSVHKDGNIPMYNISDTTSINILYKVYILGIIPTSANLLQIGQLQSLTLQIVGIFVRYRAQKIAIFRIKPIEPSIFCVTRFEPYLFRAEKILVRIIGPFGSKSQKVIDLGHNFSPLNHAIFFSFNG